MHNSYSAFAHGLRAKSPFPYPFISSSYSPSDQDLLQNPYYNPSSYQRLPLSNGHYSKQSTLLYWTPSRTFIAAAATYLATTRRSQVKLSHCTAPNSSRSCYVTVRETRCCHSHCFCDQTSSSLREARNCNKGRGQKLLEREVTQARQVWRCNGDYACDQSEDFELIERDVRRRERVLEPRFSDNARIEEHYDYWEIDNSRLRDDNTRNFNRRRRCDCEHDYEGNERRRLIDQRRRRRDECDDRFSDQRRRAEYDDYEDSERLRLSDRRRRRDEHDDKIRHSDRRRRAEYDEVEDVRNREDRIRASDRRKREEYDFEDVDNYRRRRADHKFTDQKENDVYNEKYNNIKVLDQRRRNDSYNIHGEDKLRHSDQWRRDENYDYDKEDKTRVSNQRRREGCYESDDKIRVSDQRRRDDYYESDDKIRVSDQRRRDDYYESDDKIRVSNRKDGIYNYAEEDNKMQRDERIRVSDRRGKEIYDERDSKLRVSDQRRRDAYYDYDNQDNIRVYDQRRRNEYRDYDHEDNIGIYDQRRRNEYHDYDNEDNIRISDRRRRNEHYDYDGEDNVRVSDRRRSGRNYDYDNEDTIRISDRRKRNVYYDFDGEDNVKVSDRRKKEIYDARGNSPRIMDKSRRDEYYDYDEDNRISVSDQRRRAQDYKYDEEDRIKVLDQKRKQVLSKENDKISMLDHTRREEADDYEEVFTNLQQRSSAPRVSDPKLERQSRFKETRDEGSTSYIRQTGESEGRYRKERENYYQKGLMEGSHIVKIISEDDSGLASRERENAVKITSASAAQLHSQSKTQIGLQNQRFGSFTSFRTEVAVEKEINNTLDQFTVSEEETNVQKGTHISTGGKQVGTSSSVQNQVQITRDKTNIINQLAINEIELDVQNRCNVDIQRKMVDTSSTVQSASEVARDGNNVLNQLTVTEVESDLQNRNQIEAERRRVDASTSVQSVAEFTEIRQNVVNQVTDSEAESDVQSIIHMPAESRRLDKFAPVQSVPQVGTAKHSIPTWSEVVSTVKTLNRIEAEKRRLLDTSVQNATQVASERQKIVDQLAVGEVEANVQNRSQTEAERGVVDAVSRIQNATQVAIDRQKVVDELAVTEVEDRSQTEAESGVVDTATGIHNVTQLTKEKSDVVNKLMLHDTEVNAVNRTEINQMTVNVNEASTLTDYLSGGAGSQTSIVLNQATGSSTERVGTSSLAAGSCSFRGSLESASRLDKSSSYHIGGFIDSAHKELLGESERKGPSESLGDRKSPASHGTFKTAASGITETETTVTRRTGQSLWAFVADIIKLGFLKGEARQLKSAKRSSSSDSRGTDDWFSGQEEMDIDIKNDDGKKDVQPLIVHVLDKAPSALVNVSEVDLSGTDDVTVGPALQEKTVVEEIRGHEYTSIVGDANTFGSSKSSGVYAGGVVGSASGSLLEADITISESDQKGDSKRGKLLKRMTQVPKSSFDEWEEEHSIEVETPAITATGVLLSEVTQVPDINTSLGNAMLELRPSEVMRNPGASASFSSATSDSTAVVDKGSRKHLRRLSQAPKESFEEWEEAYIREKEQRRLDEFFMREALVEAQRASDSWEVPVGAVVVRNGEVIARGCNLVEDQRDSTAHAEMVCIREASNLLHSWRLSDTTLYVTLEPCAMCAGAILQARIDTVVWGAPNKLLGADGSWVRLFPGDGEARTSLESPVQQTGPVHPFHPKITIRRGILEDECSEIMQQFFKLRRKKKNTKPETSTNPSRLPAHPLKFFSRFSGMFCA